MTGLGIDAELSEAAPRGRPEASASAIAKAIAGEPRTYGLKALHPAGLTWYARTLTPEDVHSPGVFQVSMCTSWYMRVQGSGAQ